MEAGRVHGKAASQRVSESAIQRRKRWKRLGQRYGAMRAGFGVDAFVGEAKALDRSASDEVFVDDFGGVFRADMAVPDSLRVDDDGVAVLALIEAAGLVDADAGAEAGGLHELLDGGVKFAFTVGIAGGAWCVGGTGVGADKNVAFKSGQAGLLRKWGLRPE